MKSELRKMRWVLDEGIPITPALRHLLGEVQVLSGRDINSMAISDAEVLLVRSITRVDAKLLQNSQVRLRYYPQSKL
jgi:erythronate-4-phosphate dehydrogenase